MARIFFLSIVLAAAPLAHGMTASALIGDQVTDLRGRPAGKVTDLIVNVEAPRVLYVVLQRGERYLTVPVRALRPGGSVDLRESDAAARLAEDELKFRRASSLLGQTYYAPHLQGEPARGTIADFQFEPFSGEIGRVTVRTDAGLRHYGGGVLVPDPIYPARGDTFEFLPSDERRRLHDPRWEGQWGQGERRGR